MLKLDNPFIRVIAFTVAFAFAFTTVAKAGDGQLLKSIALPDDDTEEVAAVVAETTDVGYDERGVDSLLLQQSEEIVTSGLIEPAPISTMELASLSQVDQQWNSYTNEIVAGDDPSAAGYVLLVLILVIVVVYYYYTSGAKEWIEED